MYSNCSSLLHIHNIYACCVKEIVFATHTRARGNDDNIIGIVSAANNVSVAKFAAVVLFERLFIQSGTNVLIHTHMEVSNKFRFLYACVQRDKKCTRV